MLLPSPIRDQLEEAFSGFQTLRLAVVFGSVARAEDTPHSDVDLGVLLDPEAPVEQLWDLDLAAGSALKRTIDLVDLRKAPPLLRFQITRDGRLVLEREPGEWVRFKTRAMIDWWDWAPTAREMHRIAARRLREERSDGRS